MNQHHYSDMDQPAFRIAYLIAGYIRNTLSEVEHSELDSWINESDQNMKLFEDLTDEKNIQANLEWMDRVKSEELFKSKMLLGDFKLASRKKKTRYVWIAAASVVLLIGLFTIFYNYPVKPSSNTYEVAITDSMDIRPGGYRATLTLDDRKIIDLEGKENGVIVSENGSHVNKPAAGELEYEPKVGISPSLSVHTLSTPVGGHYKVKLSDGTLVWLNAETILKYPSRFNEIERSVELTGEAYFEVAKSNKTPFKVYMGDSTVVSVLGTHFNIYNYKDEPNKLVTLLEGKVIVSNQQKNKVLEPGTQANILDRNILKQRDLDIQEVMGWKNGLFVFHDASIEQIMKQVERWYGAKVVFEGAIKHEFNASILRSEPLPKLLRLLELTGKVHFKIDKKTIYVLP